MSDTYKSTGSSRSNVELVYDPVTKKWVEKTVSNTSQNTETGSSSGQSNTTSTQTTTTVVNTNPTSQVDSKGTADKEYIEIEFNTLVGEMTLTSSVKAIKVKVNDTIKIEGIGKYLSGLYFVSAVKRTITKDNGYSHTLTVIKTGFGNSLKKVQTVEPPRVPEVPKVTTVTFKKGDKVRIVGANAVYSNAHDGVKVPSWVKQKTLVIDAVSSDNTRVRVNPIWSWTYIKYIQKV